MLFLYSAVNEIYRHICNPVATTIANKMIQEFDLKSIIDNRLFVDTGRDVPVKFNDSHHNANVNKNYFKLTVDPILNANNNLKWEMLNFKHLTGQGVPQTNINEIYNPIFTDPYGKITVYEMCMPMGLNLTGTITLTSRTKADELISIVTRRYGNGLVYAENIAYDYTLPNDIMWALFEMYKLRRFSKELLFPDYIRICSKDIINVAVNRTLTNDELVVTKSIQDAIINVEFTDAKTEDSKINKAVETYNINFTGYIQFERPDTLILTYPCVVDNQLLPEVLIPKKHSLEGIRNLKSSYPNEIVNNYMESLKISRFNPVMFPYYDDWKLPMHCLSRSRSYQLISSHLFLIDEDSDTTTIDLKEEFDEYRFHPKLLEIFKKQGNKSFDFDCIFNISVYSDDILIDKKDLNLTEDLILEIKCTNIHTSRRLVIQEITDYKYLNPELFYLIAEYYDFTILGHIFIYYFYDKNGRYPTAEEIKELFSNRGVREDIFNHLYTKKDVLDILSNFKILDNVLVLIEGEGRWEN